MFFDRDWSHIQDFQKMQNGSWGLAGTRLFHFSKNDFQYSEMSIFYDFVLFLNYLEQVGVLTIQNSWFGESWSRPLGPKIMKNMTFSIFPKWKLKVTSPKWSRIILRSFRATLFLEFTIKIAPRPPDPKTVFCQIFHKNSAFFRPQTPLDPNPGFPGC